MVFLPVLAEGQDVGKFTLPEGHLFAMVVPKGGSSCAKCKFVSQDQKNCGNSYFQDWRKSLGLKETSLLPAPADEYCCDVFAIPEQKQASDITKRVALRYLRATELDEKMKALLLKLRKGADSSLSQGQLFKVLALLGGWRVEPIIGLVPMHYTYDGEDRKESFAEEHEDTARAMYNKLQAEQVSSLPANPEERRRYVMDLEDLTSWENQFAKSGKYHGAKYNAWIGAQGWRFTDPHGKTFELLPSRFDLDRPSGRDRKKLHIWDVMKWLKADTSYLTQINELLGTEPHEKSAPRTRENTGTCGACLRNIKLVAKSNALPTMALHGYNRPGHGYVIGQCLGVGHPPYELATDATKIMLKVVTEQLDGLKKKLAHLEGDPERFTKEHGEKEIVKSDNPDLFAYELKQEIKALKWKLQWPEADFKAYSWLVSNWKQRDLPQEGQKHIDWYSEALKHAGKVPKEAALILRVAQAWL